MRKPTICGKNRINPPTSGCGDCEELEYRIKQIEDWIENPMTSEEIEALTPIECYEPPCADSRVCYGETCCMIVSCDSEPTINPKLEVDITLAVNGDIVLLNHMLRNTGNVDIENVVFSSEEFGELETIPLLGVNESVEVAKDYTPTEEEKTAGSKTFSALAVGTYDGETISASDIATIEFTQEEEPPAEEQPTEEGAE